MEIKYEIIAHYSTGDSFKTYNTCTALSAIWDNIEDAKKALEVLNEHHEYYEAAKDIRRFNRKQIDISDLKTKAWYLEPPKGYGRWDEFWQHSVLLPLKDENTVVCDTPYHGYFEDLIRLEIEMVKSEEDDSLKKTYR